MRKITVRKLVLILLTVFLFAFSVQAKYTQKCIVQYATEDGWSRKYNVDVTFLSGSELNEATNSYRYSAYSVYAVIFWDKGQATVIKISTYVSCSTVVDKNCIKTTVGDLKGKDQDEDEWKICVGDYCF